MGDDSCCEKGEKGFGAEIAFCFSFFACNLALVANDEVGWKAVVGGEGGGRLKDGSVSPVSNRWPAPVVMAGPGFVLELENVALEVETDEAEVRAGRVLGIWALDADVQLVGDTGDWFNDFLRVAFGVGGCCALGGPRVVINCWAPGSVCQVCVGGEEGWGVRLFDVVVSEDVTRQTEKEFVSILTTEYFFVCVEVEGLLGFWYGE